MSTDQDDLFAAVRDSGPFITTYKHLWIQPVVDGIPLYYAIFL